MAEFKCSRDGSVCSLSCGHPHCWRVLRTLNRSPTCGSESSESRWTAQEDEGLPTLKVANMLDDYGESPLDLFPSKFGGRASHQRGDSLYGIRSQADASERRRRAARGGLSRSADATLTRGRPAAPALRSVEVQEVFDVGELREFWDETFVARPVYVWMPGGKSKTKKANKEAANNKLSLNKASKGPEVVAIRNLTNELIPAFGLLPPPAHEISEKTTLPPESTSVIKKDIPEKVPLPTGGQPYPNVGLTPHDRRQQLLSDLKELPKDFLLEILEKVKDLEDADELIRLVEKYIGLMPKTKQDFLLAVGDVLQQKKLQPAEAVWLSSLQQTQSSAGSASKTYHLDIADLSNGMASRTLGHQQQQPSSRLSHYAPLPSIAGYVDRQTKARRIYTNVGTVRHTARPFKYDTSSIDFSLGPVFTPPRSRYDRSTRSRLSSLSDLDHMRSDATADSGSRLDPRGSPYAPPKDYAEGAVAAIWSASSSDRLPPKPPVGTPYTPFPVLRASTAPADVPTVADYALRGADGAVSVGGPGPANGPSTVDDMTAYKRQWVFKADYWEDVRRHALLTAIDEGDERGHDPNRTEKAFSAVASKLTNDATMSQLGAASTSPLPRPSSRKTSAKSQADSASLPAAEEQSPSALRPVTALTRVGSTSDHARSAASNWPQVDEEALLRLDSQKVSPLRSAEARRSARHVHVPTVEFEAEADTRQATPTSTAPQVHETPELGEYKEVSSMPLPPPPSPELHEPEVRGAEMHSPEPPGRSQETSQSPPDSLESTGPAEPVDASASGVDGEERALTVPSVGLAERPEQSGLGLSEPENMGHLATLSVSASDAHAQHERLPGPDSAEASD